MFDSQVFGHLILFSDAKRDGDDDNVNANVEDEDNKKNEKIENKQDEEKNGEKDKANGAQQKEDWEKTKLKNGSKKRKSGVEKSLESSTSLNRPIVRILKGNMIIFMSLKNCNNFLRLNYSTVDTPV